MSSRKCAWDLRYAAVRARNAARLAARKRGETGTMLTYSALSKSYGEEKYGEVVRATSPRDRLEAAERFLGRVREIAKLGDLGYPSALMLELSPDDGTRYVCSLVRSGDAVIVALVGMFAAQVDARYPVDPDGLAGLARVRGGLNPFTAALACDLANAYCGHESPLWYDWVRAEPVDLVDRAAQKNSEVTP